MQIKATMPPKRSERRRRTNPRFVTGVRSDDGTAHEVAKQPPNTGTEGHKTASHTPNWRCSQLPR